MAYAHHVESKRRWWKARDAPAESIFPAPEVAPEHNTSSSCSLARSPPLRLVMLRMETTHPPAVASQSLPQPPPSLEEEVDELIEERAWKLQYGPPLPSPPLLRCSALPGRHGNGHKRWRGGKEMGGGTESQAVFCKEKRPLTGKKSVSEAAVIHSGGTESPFLTPRGQGTFPAQSARPINRKLFFSPSSAWPLSPDKPGVLPWETGVGKVKLKDIEMMALSGLQRWFFASPSSVAFPAAA